MIGLWVMTIMILIGISDKEDLIIMETDEENMRNGANTAIPAIVVGIIVIAVILYFTVL